MNALMSPRAQLLISWAVFVVSLVAWPLSQLTVFASEPPGILALSWFAIVWTAYGNIVAAQVNREVSP